MVEMLWNAFHFGLWPTLSGFNTVLQEYSNLFDDVRVSHLLAQYAVPQVSIPFQSVERD